MKGSRRLNPGVVIALVLLITFASLFVVVFIIASEPQAAGPAVDALDIEAQAALVLEGADAERGAQLVVEHQCVNCHVYAAGQAAPGWYKLAERAAERQPPLSAAAYLYESIAEPAAYVVEGYAPAMPQNFKEALTPEETGDIIAYLLTMNGDS